MNIGFVTTWLNRGAAYVTRAYIASLSEGNQIYVYARGGEVEEKGRDEWDQNFVTWGTRSHFGIPTYIIWPDFKKWVISNRLDVIIFNEQQSWDIILKCINLGVKIGTYVDYYTRDTVPFFELFDFLLCNTQRHFGVFKHYPQCYFIPWGTDCVLYSGESPKPSNGLVTFFHSCGMSPNRKGTDLLIKSFHEIKGPTRLVIHSQVPLKDPELKNILSLDDRITLLVDTVGPPGLYHMGDVYVYPTRLEGIGLTIAEALASGLPVITADNGPMNEFVVHGLNGRLVKTCKCQKREDNYYWDECECDPKSLEDAMKFYIDHPENLRQQKINARKFAVEKLDWRINSSGLLKLIIGSKLLPKSRTLINRVALYEYSRYPGLVFQALRRKLRSL